MGHQAMLCTYVRGSTYHLHALLGLALLLPLLLPLLQRVSALQFQDARAAGGVLKSEPQRPTRKHENQSPEPGSTIRFEPCRE